MGFPGPGVVGDLIRVELGASETLSEEVFMASVTLFVMLLGVCMVIGHFLEENRWFNESITAIVMGLCTAGSVLLITGGRYSRILEFDEKLFFRYLLPPIIFNAGFQVKKRQFFQNFMTIKLFGVIGTLISFFIISFGSKLIFGMLNLGDLEARDYFAIGAIFSATDSVCTLQVLDQERTPSLYSVVFGEGVVNDATSVVLFNAIQKFDLSQIDSKIVWQFMGNFFHLFTTSTLLGVIVGLLNAYLIKKLYAARESTVREVAPMMVMAYFSYVTAEIFGLSGILTVFFCGIVMSHYTRYNLTLYSRITTKHAFATLSYIAETFIFLYVGMDALDIEKWRFVSNCPGKSAGVSAVLLGLVLVGRAAFVFPLSFLSNCFMKSQSSRIDFRQQITICWAGLMRGAVSMALAYNQFTSCGHTQLPGNATMITSTITVVLFSTVVFGFFTKPLVTFLLSSSGHHSQTASSEPSSPRSYTVPLLISSQDSETGTGSDDISYPPNIHTLLTSPSHIVQHYWRMFDDAFMCRVFGRNDSVPDFLS